MTIIFKIENIRENKAYGTLKWSEKGLQTGAYSGPYGNGELPAGLYHAYRNKLIDKEGEEGYCDSLNNCWFQVIDPQFSTERNNLGIHPDGNLEGTLGCIGLLEANTKSWYDAFAEVESYTVVEVKDL